MSPRQIRDSGPRVKSNFQREKGFTGRLPVVSGRMAKLFRTGAAYYPDYIPSLVRAWKDQAPAQIPRSERMKDDFARMKRAGLTWVRMGEFSWSVVEKRRGDLEPSLFLEALDLALAHGIDVIFCTPTATPPPWLTDEFPEILPRDRSGRLLPAGTRRHYDPTNAAYRAESRRITEFYARTFGTHAAVKCWQTDNEFGCHGSTYVYTESAARWFQSWLAGKYTDIDALNEAWHTAFWSQRYTSFSQVPLPLNSYADVNPGLELDFRRAMNDAWRIFQAEQAAILREHSPGRPVTHNFMTLFFELDPWKLSLDLDIAGFDHYQMETEAHPVSSAWQFRLMASLKKRSFMVLEQQPVQVNWQKVNRRFPMNQLFLWGMQSMFAGADSMLYFSWQRMYGGAEQYHDGLVGHDIRVGVSEQEEVLRFQEEFLKSLEEAGIQEIQPESDVCIVLDFESVWTHEITSQSELFTSRVVVDFAAGFCLSRGLGFSFVPSIAALDFSAKLVVLPSHAFELTEDERSLLTSYVEQGGIVCTLPRSLMKRRDNRMSELPVTLFHPADLRVLSYGALLAAETEEFAGQFQGRLWAERIEPGPDISVLSRFTKGMYEGSPAVLLQKKGRGRWIHLCTVPDRDLQFYAWLSDQTIPGRIDCPAGVQAYPLRTNRGPALGLINTEGDAVFDFKGTLIQARYPDLAAKAPGGGERHRLAAGAAGMLIAAT